MTTTMIARRTLLGAGAALLIPSPGRSAIAPDAIEALARRLVAAIDDAGTDAAVVTALFDRRTLDRSPADAWLRQFAALRTASGGMVFRDVAWVRDDEWIVTVALSGASRRTARLTVFAPATESPDRLTRMLAFPRPAPYPHPLPVGPLSRERLAAAIDRRVRWSAARGDFAGAVRVVAPDGSPVYTRAFGTGEGRPLAVGDRFHLGSADKSFTALMIARAVAEGRLRWDSRLGDLLPDYPNRAAAGAITVEHLVTHRAGLGGLFDRPGWDAQRRYTRVGDLLPAFADAAPAFPPGSRARYSNEGFVVLGAILERLDGRPWWDQLAEQVYVPAKMRHSAHLTADQNPPDKAIGRRFADSDDLGLRPRITARDFSGWRGNSCGGGYSTVADMTGYLQALRAGRLVAPDRLARMVAPYAGGLPGYGMGFQVRDIGNRRFVGHSGGGPHSGIDGDSAIAWESGWALSILGTYDAPFTTTIAFDLKRMLAGQGGA